MAVESEGKPIEVLVPEDVKLPSWSHKALWEQKFRIWHSLVETGCIAKRGQGGRFCGLGGHACFYAACPRRVFEEIAVFQGDINQPVPSPNFVKQLNQTLNRVAQLEGQLKVTRKELKELKELKAKS